MRGVPYKVRPTVCARVVGRPNLRVAFALLLAALLGGCGGGGAHRNNAVGEALFGYDRNQPPDAHVAPSITGLRGGAEEGHVFRPTPIMTA